MTRGVTVKAGSASVPYRAAVSHGVLTIRLRRVAGEVFVSVTGPSLGARLSLIGSARHHRTLRVRLALKLTDAARASTRLKVALRLRR